MRDMSNTGISQEPNMYFQLQKGDFENQKISWCISGTVFFKFSFPLGNLAFDVINRLALPVLLSDKNILLREEMLITLDLDEVFIHKILAHLTLDTGAVLLASDNVFTIKKRDVRELNKKFVSIPLHSNLFFIVDGCLVTKRYLCIEVHPTEAITYRVVWLSMMEVTEAKWAGPTFPLAVVEKLFSLTEAEFNQKISEISVQQGNKKRPENEEF